MRGFVANTDHDQWAVLRSIVPAVDEVNHWRPAAEKAFRALQPGEPFFFKLKAPHNAIAGFGYFAHFSHLPTTLAWEVYGQANAAATYAEFREALVRLRSRSEIASPAKGDFSIGCILINQPVFFDEAHWVRAPKDFASAIVQGKVYDLGRGEGRRIWLECLERAATARTGLESLLQGHLPDATHGSSSTAAASMFRPRLGPRSFRIAVLDAYGRRCAVTGERALPALDAAHIRDFGDAPEHTVSNGMLFRIDIHRLFVAGYVTVTPSHRFAVSRRIREEFDNGSDYERLHGARIRLPENPADHPLVEALWWHNEQRFLG